ncbi:hypothetical protein AU192_23070 [Mycobacterium lehmannii]|uniref:Uncharacterized protein n=2 Tax=Mycobacterium TaxID=1763 RepID=A0A101A5T9_9MYCO|nr:hypothetical protein [Mycobacterium lehmannii]KUI14241.1 hypothetical protein AU192_23070 [Mycobacterium lehmannii]OBB73556.1 hypothetical protein A5759_14055 [Mycobacterium sp. 852014-52144_SCH5372336]
MSTPRGDSSMAIRAANFTLRDLGLYGGQVPAGARHRSDVTELVSCHVVELEHHDVIFTAIDARVGQQVLQNVCLGACDRLLFAVAA